MMVNGNGNGVLVRWLGGLVASLLLAAGAYYVETVDARASAAEAQVADVQRQVRDTRERTIRLEVQVEELGKSLYRVENFSKDTNQKIDRLLEGRR